MKTQIDVADAIITLKIQRIQVSIFISQINEMKTIKINFILANGNNYNNSAVNNTSSTNANQSSSVDVNANEKTTAQSPNSSQQQQQQQTTTSGNTNNNSSNISSNGPPKVQRERTNRVGPSGGIRNKKPSNLPTNDKHGSEKLVNGSS